MVRGKTKAFSASILDPLGGVEEGSTIRDVIDLSFKLQ